MDTMLIGSGLGIFIVGILFLLIEDIYPTDLSGEMISRFCLPTTVAGAVLMLVGLLIAK